MSLTSGERLTARNACMKAPREIIETLLNSDFFPEWIESGVGYKRYGDDVNLGLITVGCGPDGDGRVEVASVIDPNDVNFIHRFRTEFGGGSSMRVRKALLILALAIQMDNDELPQLREYLVQKACTCVKECDCQNPPPDDWDGESGTYAISEECPIHNDHPMPNPHCIIHGKKG